MTLDAYPTDDEHDDTTSPAMARVRHADGTVERRRVLAQSADYSYETVAHGPLVVEPRLGWRLLRVYVGETEPWYTVHPVVGWQDTKYREVTKKWAEVEGLGKHCVSTEEGVWQSGGFYPVYVVEGSGWLTLDKNHPYDSCTDKVRHASRLLAPGDALPDLTGFTAVPFYEPEGTDFLGSLLEQVRRGEDR